ncbi:ABC transporter permease [Treponema brennaborense]|uniref:ABC-type transporter, integral membrane subunit n=1 Tax=Treponema brennaborense (strain DSM 12168 / CIP 105900 / DD5/3) TaxID=906968 RepID=F4LPC0_TREBD|nr:ABC transporter permease subunit [Treponema brennaborense]AEE16982.1 ABC-type transporter, integral membrane subunit [Treponema brennaborense DSM 12168]
MKRNRRRIFDSDQRMLYLIGLPFILWYVVFEYKPMTGLLIAFQDYNLFKGIAGSAWIGLRNFADFLSSPYFYVTLKNTLILNVWGLLIAFPFAILFALLLNEVRGKLFRSFVQTAAFLPYFVAIVVACGIFINMLSPTTGIVNRLLEAVGGERRYFLSIPEYFPAIFTGLGIWKNTGFNALLYLAALSGIDESLYEAAKIDGANKFHQLLHITLPSIMPTIIITLILRIGSMLNVSFEIVLLLYQPATYATSDVISTYVYRLGMEQQNFGLSTAVGLFNAIIGFFLVYGSNKISKKMSETSLW